MIGLEFGSLDGYWNLQTFLGFLCLSLVPGSIGAVLGLLGLLGLPAGVALMRLLHRHHHQPERIQHSKFLALRFQALNGLGLSAGLALAPLLGWVPLPPG